MPASLGKPICPDFYSHFSKQIRLLFIPTFSSSQGLGREEQEFGVSPAANQLSGRSPHILLYPVFWIYPGWESQRIPENKGLELVATGSHIESTAVICLLNIYSPCFCQKPQILVNSPSFLHFHSIKVLHALATNPAAPMRWSGDLTGTSGEVTCCLFLWDLKVRRGET